MSDIIMFGTGQFAETVSIYLERDSNLRIIGYTVDAARMTNAEFRGRPVFPWETLEQHAPPDRARLFGPVSFHDGNRFRAARFAEGKRRGYGFASFVHPSCHVYADSVGENCLVLELCVLQPRVTLGDNCVLWSCCHVGHHTRIGAHCFLAGRVGVAGNCQVGEGVFFGARTGVTDRLSIGDWSVLVAGALVTSDVPAGALVAAAPPRIVPKAGRRFAARYLC